MIKYLRAAFNITPLRIVMIFILSGVKYILIEFKLVASIKAPTLIVLLSSLVLFLLVVGIKGIIENRGETYETWSVRDNTSWKKKLLVSVITWSQTIPVILLYLLVVYFVAPTSLDMFIILFAGMVIRNSIDYFNKKNDSVPEEI